MPFRQPLSRAASALAVVAAATAFLTACGSSESPPQVAQVQAPTDFPTSDAGPRDSEESASFPLPAGQRGTTQAPDPSKVKAAKAPKAKAKASATGGSSVSPGAPTDAEVRRELQQMNQAMKEQSHASPAAGSLATVEADGQAQVPPGAPLAVERIIAGGNAISHFPYVYGGGHASFIDSAYDCSASLSYALAAAGLLKETMTSGELAHWGAAGPGKWVTIYANETHTFMYVAGLRFDTSGRDGPLGSRWQTAPRSLAGFAVRHPIGL